MQIRLAVLCACLIATALGGCEPGPGSSRKQVIAQATPGAEIAFDVVKVDDGVLKTLAGHSGPAFHQRFKNNAPQAELKIAVGDTVGVVIWESSPSGLFGESLQPEVQIRPGGVWAELFSNAGPGQAEPTGPAQNVPGTPQRLTQTLAPAGAMPQIAAACPAVSPASLSAQTPGGQALAEMASPAVSGAAARAATANGTAGAEASARPRQKAGSLDDLRQAAVADSSRAGTCIPDQQVATDGAISIPYAGRVRAAGRTPAQVQRTIERRLAGKAIEPQVLVLIRRSLANSVTVSGGAIAGARLPLNPGGERLLQVIAEAGGAQAAVHDTFVQLSRGGVTASIPLAEVVAHPEENIFVEPGDVLTLSERPQTFSVFGAAGKNTAVTFDQDRLTLSEALAKSGGLDDNRADPQAVFLFRYEPVEVVRALGQPIATRAPNGLSPVAYRLDLRDPRGYLLARRFPVRDKDIILVADAEIRPLYQFFNVLNQVVGPVESGLLVCQSTAC